MIRDCHAMRRVLVSHGVNSCWYPSCVGRSATWVISPVALNILLSVVTGRQASKYNNIHNELKTKKVCKLKTGLFHSPSYNIEANIKNFQLNDLSRKEVDFSKNANSISQWVNQIDDFKEFSIEKIIPPGTSFALVNVCNFEGTWEAVGSGGRFMKVHNSFTYTQDINYEARILELPMQDEDFRVVVLVPNEVDLVHTLYRRLVKEGLAASFTSIQPLFSVNSVFQPPNVAITSQTEIDLREESKNLTHKSVVQYGSVTIDEKGAHAKVLSCLYSTNSEPALPIQPVTAFKNEKPPFFFAITFKDTPLFTGQYVS